MLKSRIRQEKARALTANITDTGNYRLESKDFMRVVAPAWNAAFARDVNIKAWQKTGCAPSRVRSYSR